MAPKISNVNGSELRWTLSQLQAAQDSVDGAGRDNSYESAAIGSLLAYLNLTAETDGIRPSNDDQDLESWATSLKGIKIGRFTVEEVVGHGGFGVVFRAFDSDLRRAVAVKVPRPDLITRLDACGRFLDEARMAAALRHPGIVQVLDIGTLGPLIYIASEFSPGVTLQDWIRQQPAPIAPRVAVEIVMDLANTMGYAHARRVIHQDLKPANVLVEKSDDGKIVWPLRITDFGLAVQVTEDGQIGDRLVGGTRRYMAPEQDLNLASEIGTHTDVYALGALLLELLTGSLRFARNGSSNYVERIHSGQTSMVRKIQTGALRDLEAIIDKCLAKKPVDRYTSAQELHRDLERFLRHEPVHARDLGIVETSWRLCRKRPWVSTLTAALFTTVIAGSVATSMLHSREQQARSQANEAEGRRRLESVRADELTGFVQEYFDEVIPQLSQSGHQDSIKRLLVIAEDLASRIPTAPRAESHLRLQIGQAYTEYLGDHLASEVQYRLAESTSGRITDQIMPLTALARVHRMDAQIWQDRRPEAFAELTRLSTWATEGPNENNKAAVFALSRLALHYSWTDTDRADTFARRCLSLTRDKPEFSAERLYALRALTRACIQRNRWAEAADAAKLSLAIFPRIPPGELVRTKEEILRMYAQIAMAGNLLNDHEAALTELDKHLSTSDTETRSLMTSSRGELLARQGRWNESLQTLTQAVDAKGSSILTWETACLMARLLNDEATYRSLCISGLAHFGGGADDEISRRLADQLCHPWSGFAGHPIIGEFIERAKRGRPREQFYVAMSIASTKFESGDVTKAESAIDSFIRECEAGTPYPGFQGPVDGYFLQARIKTSVGKYDEARKAYRKGLPFTSPSFIDRSVPFTGAYWDGGAWVELARREAAAALRDAGLFEDMEDSIQADASEN